jgi:hypothetical protein
MGAKGVHPCLKCHRLAQAETDTLHDVESAMAALDQAIKDNAMDRLALTDRLIDARKAHSKAIAEFYSHREDHGR